MVLHGQHVFGRNKKQRYKMIQLRKYQEQAIEAILAKRKDGVTRQLISIPTGGGKTITFAELTRRMNCKTLIVAHTDELITQAIDKVGIVIGSGSDIGRCQAFNNDIEKKIVVSSIQSICRETRLEQLKAQNFELLIIDECHHSTANSYQKVIKALGFMDNNPAKLLVGFTATSQRGDRKALAEVFQEITYQKEILYMIEENFLCDLRGIRIETDIDLDGVASRCGDFVESQLEAVVNTDSQNELIVDSYIEHLDGQKTIAFCVNVAHSQDLAEAFQDAGIKAAAVYGSMKPDDRKTVIEDFANGEIQVLTNCMVLTEGFDEPSITGVMMCRPTKNPTLYTQCIGRGLRTFPNKKECLVLDFTANNNKILGLGSLLGADAKGKPKDIKNNQSILEAIQEQIKIASKGNLVSTSFDLIDRSPLKWTILGNAGFKLPLGNNKNIFVMRGSDGRYSATIRQGDDVIGTLIQNADQELCIGVSEGYAKQNNCAHISNKTAPWRSRPASPGQLSYLEKLGYNTKNCKITMGEASEIIEESKAWQWGDPSPKQVSYLKRIGQYHDGMTKIQACKLIAESKAM